MSTPDTDKRHTSRPTITRKRNRPVAFYLTDLEYDWVREKAESMGVSIRELVMGALTAYHAECTKTGSGGTLTERVQELEERLSELTNRLEYVELKQRRAADE